MSDLAFKIAFMDPIVFVDSNYRHMSWGDELMEKEVQCLHVVFLFREVFASTTLLGSNLEFKE